MILILRKFPVFFPVNGNLPERAVRSGLPPPPVSPRVFPVRFAPPRKTRENPHKIRLLDEAAFSRETSWHWGFGAIPGALSVVGEFARVGVPRSSPRRPGQSGRRRHPSKKSKPCSKRGVFAVFFRVWWSPRCCWGFWRKRVVERGVFVVNLWWIAGETWRLDGHFSGSKNLSPFQDLFLGVSHFGNGLVGSCVRE